MKEKGVVEELFLKFGQGSQTPFKTMGDFGILTQDGRHNSKTAVTGDRTNHRMLENEAMPNSSMYLYK